jgi:hypothetical protein
LTIPNINNITAIDNKSIKLHKNCTDNGVSKIMYTGNKSTVGKLLVLST